MNNDKKKNKVQCPKCNNEFEIANGGELKTGLYWEGKRTDVERISLPFQVIETVNESRATREKEKGTFFEGQQKTDTSWRNKLIWGDNKYVMSSLLDEFAGGIDLIYIDPPFATGADFSFRTQIGEGNIMITKEQSIIEEKAYRDTWGKGVDSYLQMMYERLILMRELLSEIGSIYVHCDYRVNSHMRLILEEIFGSDNYRNEIIWLRSSSGKTTSRNFPRDVDTIFWFSKSSQYIFNRVFMPLSEKTIAMYNKDDGDGRGRYRLFPLQKTASPGPETTYDYKDNTGKIWKCPQKGWRMKYEKLKVLENDNRLLFTGGTLQEKAYWNERENEGKIANNLWNDIPNLQGSNSEIVGYETQKPESLLERIIKASSSEGDIVADFFCGSGTTGAVAEKLGRKWIVCDLSRFAVHTTRKRLLEIDGCRPFEVLNLGKYERQYWQGITFGDSKKKDTKKTISEYLQFIVKLYQGEPITGFRYLHGKKGRMMVSVGSVDAPVTLREIQEALEECKSAGQKELDVLGWEWEMGLHDVVEEESKSRGINLHLKTIPREVMDARAVDSGEIQFFELAYLDAKVSKNKYDEFVIELNDFVIQNTDLIPEEVRKKIKKWSDYIDYWAVDWEYKDDTFHNQWQSYRTRKDRTLQLKSDGHKYDKKGKYTIMIKVIDIFGNDTTHIEEVTI